MALRTLPRDYVELGASIVVCQLAGVVPGLATAGAVAAWYPTLTKPWYTPPAWVFAPVWTLLFLLMGVALFLVYRSRGHPDRSLALGLFAAQLVFNAGWSVAFFGFRSPTAGLVVVAVLWLLVVATTAWSSRVDRRAGLLLVPYLAWVTFAAVLTAGIWRLN